MTISTRYKVQHNLLPHWFIFKKIVSRTKGSPEQMLKLFVFLKQENPSLSQRLVDNRCCVQYFINVLKENNYPKNILHHCLRCLALTNCDSLFRYERFCNSPGYSRNWGINHCRVLESS